MGRERCGLFTESMSEAVLVVGGRSGRKLPGGADNDEGVRGRPSRSLDSPPNKRGIGLRRKLKKAAEAGVRSRDLRHSSVGIPADHPTEQRVLVFEM